jgi:hypothetical protein
MTDRPVFERHPREGGYTYITAPGYPGFSVLLEPGEDDTPLNESWDVYFAAWQKFVSGSTKPKE